jgi:hypothetical protein
MQNLIKRATVRVLHDKSRSSGKETSTVQSYYVLMLDSSQLSPLYQKVRLFSNSIEDLDGHFYDLSGVLGSPNASKHHAKGSLPKKRASFDFIVVYAFVKSCGIYGGKLVL